jgi:hypothetical protein
MRYALQFEERLEAVQISSPGAGCLIFSGNGVDWNPSELEDFADFYLTRKHRPNDPFATATNSWRIGLQSHPQPPAPITTHTAPRPYPHTTL